jgi:hypothetical protein
MIELSVINGDAPPRPLLDFGRGRFLRHIIDNTYEWTDLDGRHEKYVTALAVRYEPTLYGQYCKSLRAK